MEHTQLNHYVVRCRTSYNNSNNNSIREQDNVDVLLCCIVLPTQYNDITKMTKSTVLSAECCVLLQVLCVATAWDRTPWPPQIEKNTGMGHTLLKQGSWGLYCVD